MGQIAFAGLLLVYSCARLAFDGFTWLRAVLIVGSIAWVWIELNAWRAKRNADLDNAAPPTPAPAQAPIFTREHAAALRQALEFNRAARQPPPELSEEEVRATARPAIFLRRASLPAPLDDPGRSYFGGLPRLPAELAWPEKGEHALTFLAQIDLAELPVIDAAALPRTGTLYFFSDANSECPEGDDGRVLYYAGDASRVPLRTLPSNIRRYGIGGEIWPWLPDDSLWTQTTFRLPIEFVRFDSFSGWIPSPHGLPPHTAKRVAEVLAAECDRVCGPDDAPLDSPRDSPWEDLARDTDAWPFAWVAIEFGARSFIHSVDEAARRAEAKSVSADYARMRQAMQPWLERSRTEAPHSLVDDATRAKFLAEWRALVAEHNRVSYAVKIFSHDPLRDLRNVVMAACYVCASHGASQLIPDVYRSALERWNDVRRTFPQHQMLGYGLSVQSAAYERVDQVLLLQIKGDIGLGWHSNNGCVLQFWITPEQLAERAFQAVDLTLECD